MFRCGPILSNQGVNHRIENCMDPPFPLHLALPTQTISTGVDHSFSTTHGNSIGSTITTKSSTIKTETDYKDTTDAMPNNMIEITSLVVEQLTLDDVKLRENLAIGIITIKREKTPNRNGDADWLADTKKGKRSGAAKWKAQKTRLALDKDTSAVAPMVKQGTNETIRATDAHTGDSIIRPPYIAKKQTNTKRRLAGNGKGR